MSKIVPAGLERRVKHKLAKGRSALANYLVSGSVRGFQVKHCADFSNFVFRQGGRQDSGFPDRWRVDDQFIIDEPARLAVVIHCFYEDLLPELFSCLHNIPIDFDLFLTNASGKQIEIPTDLERMGHAVVVDVENRGRDIFPLVQLVNSGALDPYELVLKMHTKKSPWREAHTELAGSGATWNDQFLDGLVGTAQRPIDILNAFAADSSIGLVTADESIVGSEFWGGDQRISEELLRRLEMSLDHDRLRFASGSMYWIRGFLLQGLRAMNLQRADFDEESGQVDGTTAHALERIIGILTEEAGLSLAEISDLAVLSVDSSYDTEGYLRFGREAPRSARAQIVPFYLPQFHDSPQNNRWWGDGFTEWTNVTSAIPGYRGHYQPKIPTDLGFYDLALDSVRQKQADLAKAHGIAGFMYYYYWFSGERLLNLPIEKMRASDVDMPYSIMWANENWTRRWDGRSQDILIGQDYSRIPAEDFIDDIMEFLSDPRYMRVDGKALISVYRPGQMKNFPDVVSTWRKRAREAGVGELFVLAVAVADEFDGVGADVTSLGLDGTLQFPPHNLPWVAGPATDVGLDQRWRGNFMSYPATVDASLAMTGELSNQNYPGAMVTFDNTARRQWKADTWYGSNPYTFHRWVMGLISAVLPREPKDRLVFINAWNEWAEGAILEPTTRFGRTYLLAIRDAVWC
ncbi:glycoside hydrolase family 99-like domain-containing protein [Propionimicrobium sp. PCR01-08-3]|uniref:glycoside hydrolase family 99-like domain-containing protein n=1 Tax=Propionimicrobium sp. PCR01-08-3 TaxID=3052086 RepID=UPI00255CA9B1|nr:glycoside hydrolase family 99-like domain-containing protein [Propionimicrobium sp. PCR01-08-3]WIY82641.1 glycoside hydrolase family 99-like domain-containing protein [Propionimicrobium sp. PCR01-08-3]